MTSNGIHYNSLKAPDKLLNMKLSKKVGILMINISNMMSNWRFFTIRVKSIFPSLMCGVMACTYNVFALLWCLHLKSQVQTMHHRKLLASKKLLAYWAPCWSVLCPLLSSLLLFVIVVYLMEVIKAKNREREHQNWAYSWLWLYRNFT